MKRKFLEDMGLTKEQIDSIMDENGKDVNAAKGDLEQVKTELKQTKGQLTERDQQIETLKTSAGDNDGLKQQIADLQEQNKQKDRDHQEEIKNLRLDAAIRSAIGDSAQDADLVSGLIDKAKLLLSDDGKVTGLEEQVKALKENKAFLFKDEGVQDPQPGFRVGASRGQDPKPAGTSDKPVDMKAAITAGLKATMQN